MRSTAWVFACIAAIASSAAACAVPRAMLFPLILTSGALPSRSDLVLSPDGKICAAAYSGQIGATLWDAGTGQLLRALSDAASDQPSGRRTPEETWLAFSPDGKLLSCGMYSTYPFQHREPTGAVELFEVSSGNLKHRLDGAGPVCFSADGKLLVSGGVDSALRVWDVSKGQLVQTLPRQERFPREIAVSPDGSTLASTDEVKLRLWNIQTGEPMPVEITPTMIFTHSPQFSPDGRTLAMAGMSEGEPRRGWIELFDIQTGGLLRTLKSHSISAGDVDCIAFDRSGGRLAGGMSDGTAEIWAVGSGRVLGTVKGDGGGGGLQRVSFTPTGTELLVWQDGGPTQFWDVKSGHKLREWKMWRRD